MPKEKSCFSCKKFAVCKYYEAIKNSDFPVIMKEMSALTNFLGDNCIHFDKIKE